MNKAAKYHEMTDLELKAEYTNKKQELFNLRFQHSTGQLANPLQLNVVKKDIARVLTVMREREGGIVKIEGKKAATKTTPKTNKGGRA